MTFLMLASVLAWNPVPMGGNFRAGITYNVHSPIYVDGDADLLAKAATEPWSGSGTAGDPILIRDYEIDASGSGYGIWITNTRLHVSIELCWIYGGYSAGVNLNNATNVTILQCQIENCNAGVNFLLVYDSIVAGTNCTNSNTGLNIDSSGNVSFSKVTCDLNVEGAYAYNVTGGRFVNCTFSYNSDAGLWFESCGMMSADLCHADYNDYGVYANDCYWMMLTNSTCLGQGSEGVYVGFSNMFMIANNTITGTSGGDGVYIEGSHMFLVADNNLSENNFGAYLSGNDDFGFERNNISSDSSAGVMADWCGNYGIRNNTCYQGNMGVYVSNSNGSVSENRLWNTVFGVYVIYSQNLDVGENDCSRSSYGMYFESCVDLSIWNNTCSWCNGAGIYAYSVSASRFTNNNCSNGTSVLLLVYSDGNEVSNNLCSGNTINGIDLEVSNNNIVFGNECGWNDCGIFLAASVNNSVSANSLNDNIRCGIEVSVSSDLTRVAMNSVSGSQTGILVSDSRDANVVSNIVTSNPLGGIALKSSINVSLELNNMIHNGVWIEGNQAWYWYSHHIGQDNLVNGKPLVYLANQTSRLIGEDAGQVILANSDIVILNGKNLSDATVGVEIGFCSMVLVNNSDCGLNHYGAYVVNSDHVGISNSSFGGSETGIEMSFCTDSMADNNTCWGGDVGIRMGSTNRALVKDNVVTNEGRYGIFMDSSRNIALDGNVCNMNEQGILIYNCPSFFGGVRDNTCDRNSQAGIRIDMSDSVGLENNSCSDNLFGVQLWFSADCMVRNCDFSGNGIYIVGYSLGQWNTHSIDGNTVNGKPLYFYKDQSVFSVPSDAGQVILANCDSVDVSGADVRDASVGVEAGFSTNVQVAYTNCSDQYIGIYLFESDGFSVNGCDCSNELDAGIYVQSTTGGSISNSSLSWSRVGLLTDVASDLFVVNDLFFNNTEHGVYLGSSTTQCQIWNNTFAYNNGALDNSSGSFLQAYDEGSGNTWYDPVNNKGNYWNDWVAPDANADGIVDSPYLIQGPAGSRDMYPLVNPFVPIPEFGLLVIVPLLVLFAALVKRQRK